MKHTLEVAGESPRQAGRGQSISASRTGASAPSRRTRARYTTARPSIIASGTYLDGRTIVGEVLRSSGPDGLAAAIPLAERLRALGLNMRRFKTGTPPRVNARTVDFSKMELQRGDEEVEPLFILHGRRAAQLRRVLPDLHQRAHARDNPRKSRPQPDIFRRYRGHRPALLPQHRDKGDDLCRQAAPSAVHRADGAEHRGAVHSGLLVLDLPEEVQIEMLHSDRRARARGDDALRPTP